MLQLVQRRQPTFSASIGIVMADAKYQHADEYLRDTEIAMYHAKSLGRAQHIFFEDRLRGTLRQSILWAVAIPCIVAQAAKPAPRADPVHIAGTFGD